MYYRSNYFPDDKARRAGEKNYAYSRRGGSGGTYNLVVTSPLAEQAGQSCVGLQEQGWVPVLQQGGTLGQWL